jgi:hypothetical protein
MKWFIVAMMSVIYPDGNRDIFVFDRQFNTYEECQKEANIQLPFLIERLWIEFGEKNPNNMPHMISCVTEDVVEQFKIFKKEFEI